MPRDATPPTPNTAWVDSFLAHLQLANQLAHKISAAETLEPPKLLECAKLLNDTVVTFQLMMEIQGFNFKTGKFE